MNSKKLIVGVVVFIVLSLAFFSLPDTITDNENLYLTLGIAYLVFVLVGGLYVAR